MSRVTTAVIFSCIFWLSASPGAGKDFLADAAGSTPALSSVAPDPPFTPYAPTYSEELSVASRALEGEGNSATVLSRKEIEASQARSVGDLLRRVAGVQLLSSGGRGGRSTARLRGGNSNFTLVMLDGVPLNNPTDVEGGSFDFASLPADHVERIEILRGPQSYYFGSSALAGVINIVSRQGNHGDSRVEAGLEIGDASLLHASAAYSAAGARAKTFFGISWDEERGRIANESFGQLNAHGNLTLDLGSSSLRLSTRFADWRTEDYPEASGGPVFGSGDLRSADRHQWSIGAVWELGNRDGGTSELEARKLQAGLRRSGDAWRHSLAASIDRQRAEIDSPGVFPLVPPSVEDTLFTRSRLAWLAAWEPTDGPRLRFGTEVERESGDNVSILLLPDFFGGPVAGDYDLERTTPGAFAELTGQWGDLRVEAGVRADLPEDLDTEWSPRLGLSYGFTESGLLLRASWSRAFKLPSFFALASPPQLGGNPALLPEKSEGWDLGLEVLSKGGKLEAGIGLFHNRYKDLIDFDFDLFQSVNRSSVEAEGAELYLRLRPQQDLALSIDWTWQDVDDPSYDRPLLNQPETFGSLRFEWTPAPPLRLQLEARYTGSSADTQIPVSARTSVEAYTVVDVGASWSLHSTWQLQARLDNLTDESYEHFIGFPEPGRSFRAGIRYRPR